MAVLQLFNEALSAQEAGTPLPPAGTATVNGKTIDLFGYIGGANAPYWFRASVSADQAGTLNIQQSEDGVAWFTDSSTSQATTAGKAVTVQLNICQRFIRAQFVNGAVACTTFQFTSALVG